MPHEGGILGRFCLGMLNAVQLSMWTCRRSGCGDKGKVRGVLTLKELQVWGCTEGNE